MDLSTTTALVTGANRGIGRHVAQQLLARGAAVYATARDPRSVDVPGARVLGLDITDPDSVAAAAAAAPDVSLVVNNAGISTRANLVTGDLAQVRLEMETHFFGTLNVVRAFAPALAANGGGAVANVMSALSFFSVDGATAYSAAKAAEWSLTNGIRLELAAQGTLVTGVHLAATDTAMMAGYAGPMNDPADVARTVLDGLEAGVLEVLVDEDSVRAKAGLSADPGVLYPQVLAARTAA